jgi:hypothetical protein
MAIITLIERSQIELMQHHTIQYIAATLGRSRISIRTCLVSFKNYLQEGQYNHLKTAVKGAFTVFPKSPTFV